MIETMKQRQIKAEEAEAKKAFILANTFKRQWTEPAVELIFLEALKAQNITVSEQTEQDIERDIAVADYLIRKPPIGKRQIHRKAVKWTPERIEEAKAKLQKLISKGEMVSSINCKYLYNALYRLGISREEMGLPPRKPQGRKKLKNGKAKDNAGNGSRLSAEVLD